MEKFYSEIKRYLDYHTKRGTSLKKAYKDLKTKLYKNQKRVEKMIQDIKDNAAQKGRTLTPFEKARISGWSKGVQHDLQKRLQVEELEDAGWSP